MKNSYIFIITISVNIFTVIAQDIMPNISKSNTSKFDSIELNTGFQKELQQNVKTLQAPIRLESINITANSTGPITPQFIYKGIVDSAAEDLVNDPSAFTLLINGSSLSSVPPNDAGQFYLSQGGGTNAPLSRMLRRIQNVRSTLFELRFGADDVGLAGDLFNNGVGIFEIPFTAWDLNGTPGNTTDDIQLLVVSLNFAGTDPLNWGIRIENPSPWLLNPAKESDWIYLFYPATSYADFQAAYNAQQQSGQPADFEELLGTEILSRVTVNSLDANPLTTINSNNGLPRPTAGTIIRWNFLIDPIVNVLSPNGNEIWNEDMSHKIEWNTNEFFNINRIQLSYSVDNGQNYTILIDSTDDDGIYGWKIPRTPSEEVLVKVSAYESGILVGEDVSNVTFTIQDVATKIHRTGTIGHTVRNDGLSGSGGATFVSDEPSLEFPDNSGNHHLYIKNLVLGAIASANDTIATRFWTYESFLPTTAITTFNHGDYEETTTTYRDIVGLDIIVEESTFSFLNKSFVILKYKLYSANPPGHQALYIGSFCDFDVNDYSQNLSGFDQTNRLGYIYDATGVWSSYAGIAMLDNDPLAFRRAGTFSGFLNNYPPAIYNALAIPGFDDPTGDPPEDYRLLESIGPYSISQNDTVTIAFVLLAGNGLSELQSTTQHAQDIWNGASILSESATDITEFSAKLTAQVNPNYLETNVMFEYGETLSYGSIILATPTQISGTNAVTVEADLSGLIPEKTYHYRAVVINHAKRIEGNDQVFTTSDYQTDMIISNVTNFPSHDNISDYQPSDYQIIGLPGNYNNSISNLLSGNHTTGWQLYWDNGAESTDPTVYLNEYDGGSNFICSVGRAFWLVHKGNWEISGLQISTAPLNNNGEAEIPLHPGWNLITNPFASPVHWGGIQSANNISEPIWKWPQGGSDFLQSADLQPYMGYYFDNDTSLSVLKIPYTLTSSNANPKLVVDPAMWRVIVDLQSGSQKQSSISFGVSDEAKEGIDLLDFRKPRSLSNISSVYFQLSGSEFQTSHYASDIRSFENESKSWEFKVYLQDKKPMLLNFRGINTVPSNSEIYLIDKTLTKSLNLRSDSMYTLKPVKNILEFEVIVGEFIEVTKRLGALIPKHFSLGQNFPNPFNSTTTIPVFIPTDDIISLNIFNIRGQRVRTLFNGKMTAGRHWLSWNGEDHHGNIIPSGVYFYQLINGNRQIYTEKLIILK